MPKGPITSHGLQTDLRTQIGARDARIGLGYGSIEPSTQFPRSLGNVWPYYEKEELPPEDETIDQDTADAVASKSLNYHPGDFGNASKLDPFYFAGGNTKLSDCFFRTEKVLQEIAVFNNVAKNSIGPIPSLYAGANAGLSSGPSFVYPGGGGTNFKRTGTLQGWSHAPAPVNVEDSSESSEDDEIFTLKDLATKILMSAGEMSESDDI